MTGISAMIASNRSNRSMQRKVSQFEPGATFDRNPSSKTSPYKVSYQFEPEGDYLSKRAEISKKMLKKKRRLIVMGIAIFSVLISFTFSVLTSLWVGEVITFYLKG